MENQDDLLMELDGGLEEETSIPVSVTSSTDQDSSMDELSLDDSELQEESVADVEAQSPELPEEKVVMPPKPKASPTKMSKSPREHKINFYKRIAYTFIGASLAVLIGLIYFSLSQGVIKVSPALEDVTSDFQILLKTDTDQTESGISAKLLMTEVEIEKIGRADILEEGGDAQATGRVTLKNTSGTDQPLVENTRLLSEEGVLFRLTDGATVPANGEVVAEVFADQAGKEGEVAPTRFTIPGLNQARQQEVYAESSEQFTGGTEAVYEITQSSVDSAIEEAKLELVDEARKKLEEEGAELAMLLANSESVEVLEQSVEPEVGSDEAEFTVSLKAAVLFVLADENELKELAQNNLYKNSSIGYEITSSNEGSFEYELVNINREMGSAQLRIMLSGQRRISLNHPSLSAENLAGKKPEELKNELQADPAIESVEVELRPFWQRRVPRLVDHIYVQLGE